MAMKHLGWAARCIISTSLILSCHAAMKMQIYHSQCPLAAHNLLDRVEETVSHRCRRLLQIRLMCESSTPCQEFY
ncbi:hypothetical protein EDD18DRAFT_848880 [Armillaria luteobubalina]|uniref:Secreted protein n=1 Tax=Armillaria luteobubalina TaxID=153913 RepID=A0AA39UZC9_9AGAR|nr:hypothetical protein EDD18DRAFT_848880 [Armillaria luteobubalina]